MASQDQSLDFKPSAVKRETFAQSSIRKFKENPFLLTGMAGWAGVVAYGVYKFKQRKGNTGLYIIQFRMLAQATIVGTLCLGVGYQLYQRQYGPKIDDSDERF